MYVSSMYDEIKCLTCGVYQERSEGEANPAQKLMLFSLLFMLQDFSSCVSTKVFAYCFVVMQLYSSTLWWWWWRKWTGTWGNLQHHSQLQTLLFYKKHLLRFTLARFLVETFQNQNGKWATEIFSLGRSKVSFDLWYSIGQLLPFFFCFPPSLFSNVTFPYFSEDKSRLNCYFCLFSSFRCITVCKCFVSITFNTIVIMISFPNSNAKHRFRSVNFPENKKRLLLYHYLQGKGLLIDRNSTAFSSY